MPGDAPGVTGDAPTEAGWVDVPGWVDAPGWVDVPGWVVAAGCATTFAWRAPCTTGRIELNAFSLPEQDKWLQLNSSTAD